MGFGANYNGQKYGINTYLRRILKNFITPSNLLVESGNWFQLNGYVKPLSWLSFGQDISFSDLNNINLGMHLGVNKYPLPDFSYGASVNRKTEIISQNLHSGWHYKRFSVSGDYAWSSVSRSFGLRISQDIKNFRIWSLIQFNNGNVYQLGGAFPVSANLRTKLFLNLMSQNGYTKSNKGMELVLRLFKNFSLNTTYELLHHNSKAEHHFSLSMSNSLFFEQTGLSFITGRVFMDLNNNGIYDSEDCGVSEAEVILDKKTVIKTDKNGGYRFDFVPVGEHTLSLNLGSTPAEIGTEKGRETVNTKILSKAKVFFPLSPLGLIEGIVYYDGNKNSRMDTGEEGVSNVVVGLNGFLTTTDKNGKFRFANLVSGTYNLDVKLLPPETYLSSAELVYIYIKPGEKFQNYTIGVIKKERSVLKKTFEEPQIIPTQKPPVVAKPKPPRVSPEDIENLFRKGVAYFIASQYHEAIKIFDRVLELEPNHERALEYKKRTNNRLKVLQQK